MQATATTLAGRGVAASRIYVTLERHMECGIGLCGHCQMGKYFVCRDGPVFSIGAARRHLRPGGHLMRRPPLPVPPRRRPSPRRRRQVRLLRRLPAHAPRPRGRAAVVVEHFEIVDFPEATLVALAGTVRRALRGGLGVRAGPPGADRRAPAAHPLPRHDRRLRHRRRDPGAPQLGRPRRVPGRGLRQPRVGPFAGPLHARSRSTSPSTPSSAAAPSTPASSWSCSRRSPRAAARSCGTSRSAWSASGAASSA